MRQKNKDKRGSSLSLSNPFAELREETVQGIFVVVFFVLAAVFALAAAGFAGVMGDGLYRILSYLLGIGYFLLPVLFVFLAVVFFRNVERRFNVLKLVMALFLFLSGLGLIELADDRGGVIGSFIASPLIGLFDVYATTLLLSAIIAISLLVILEARLTLQWLSFLRHLKFWGKEKRIADIETDALITNPPQEESSEETAPAPEEKVSAVSKLFGTKERTETEEDGGGIAIVPALFGAYTPPPLSLIEKDRGKPGVGDIKANANLIKRTLQNFGITVEMDEISIGPSVTRYALKPAEGVRLSKIVGLQNNLELALAAHPVRIEAPIPGKSLVGIEVPNTAKVTVGLASLLSDEKFQTSNKQLLVALGRDIGGQSHFGNLAKAPHMLIAGATGSGKSVSIHTIITSLLYRNSPDVLRFIMIDPKRVELTLYNKIPHLLTPVITDPKKAILALKWASKEMERRYNILEAESVRDVESYHANVFMPSLQKIERGGKKEEGELPESMPYIVIIIDELADIMQTYPRELEAAVVRLAQMSRAVGIHLLLSTQRPSVNVITGLIKANIPARIALQVASQIDSRTILDTSGAEKLLGAGDMLYLSGEMGKPMRLQSAFISEDEVKRVVSFLAKHNEAQAPGDITSAVENAPGDVLFDSLKDSGDDDDLYEDARAAVLEAEKASTSYLQRKLRIGYSRAARLMDILEERGVIGPADGSRPREVIGAAPTSEEEV